MTALPHTPHPWGWLRAGAPGQSHLVGAHGRRPVVLGPGTVGGSPGSAHPVLVQRDPQTGLLVPLQPDSPDGQLIALATTAPHDCPDVHCPGSLLRRALFQLISHPGREWFKWIDQGGGETGLATHPDWRPVADVMRVLGLVTRREEDRPQNKFPGAPLLHLVIWEITEDGRRWLEGR